MSLEATLEMDSICHCSLINSSYIFQPLLGLIVRSNVCNQSLPFKDVGVIPRCDPGIVQTMAELGL